MRDWNESGVFLEHLLIDHQHLHEELESVRVALEEVAESPDTPNWRMFIGERFETLPPERRAVFEPSAAQNKTDWVTRN